MSTKAVKRSTTCYCSSIRKQALINADSANNLRLKIKLEGLKGDDAINALLDKGPHATGESPFKIQGGNVTPIRKR